MKRILTGLGAVLLLSSAPLPALQLGEIQLERCELGASGLGETISARCAEVQVPADPEQPGGKLLSLKVAMVPARDAKAAPDPLLLIAGGPGQSALDSYPQLAAALDRINQSRHIVLIDQRGTGGSSALSCSQAANEISQSDPAALRAITEACVAELKHDPRLFTTTQAVADLELLRQRFGFSQYNLYGVSYGTRVAQVYMRSHPQSLRSVILDGVVPPQLHLGGNFGERLDQALVRMFGHCSADPACHERFPDPMSSLRVLKAQLGIAPVEVAVADPRSGELVKHTVNADRLASLVRLYAYAPETQALLPLVVETAAKGNLGPLLAQSLMLEEQLEGALNQGMQLSVICSEDLSDGMQPSTAEQESLLGAALMQAMQAQCAVWPRGKRPDNFHDPLDSAIPTLLLSGELDPVTPPEYGEQALKGLKRARHLVARGQGHNVLARGCVPKLATQFVETADPVVLDPKCMESLHPAPFFLNFNGTAP